MSRQTKNKARGFFLLLVFSLNTVAGFACSLGVDMGYNKTHHAVEASHSHQKAASHTHSAQHSHKHSPAKPSTTISGTQDNDDCCANDITDFIKLDKSIVASQLVQSPVYLMAFVSQFLLPLTEEPLSAIFPHWLPRSWSLADDTDLRIVIQSFQI
jgi:hypothetical protein